MENGINKLIVKTIKKKKWTIHGAQAVMKQLPSHLRRETEDWDIWAKKPKTSSVYLEQVLEKRQPGDQFRQNKMQLGDTKRYVYSVVERETNKTIADFMPHPAGNVYTVIGGLRYETLSHAKLKYKQILANPALRQRHAKAKGDLLRIEQFEFETKRGTVKPSTLRNISGVFNIKKVFA